MGLVYLPEIYHKKSTLHVGKYPVRPMGSSYELESQDMKTYKDIAIKQCRECRFSARV